LGATAGLEIRAEGMGDTSLSRVSSTGRNRVDKRYEKASHFEGRKGGLK
jgi:hypothetical protein